MTDPPVPLDHPPSPDPGRRQSLRILLAIVFVVMVGYGITLTVLPYYTERVHGLSGADLDAIAIHIGVLTSVYALAQLVAAPLLGRLGDLVGRRPLILAGLGGMAITQVAFGFATELWVLYALRVAGGVAGAAMLVAATASVADLTAESDRARGMAWFGTAVSLGLVAGPVLGGLASQASFSWGPAYLRLDGFSLPFVIAGTLALGVLGMAWRRLPESLDATPATTPLRAPGPSAGRVETDRRRPGLRALLVLVTLSQFGLALFEGTFVLFAKDRLAITTTQASVAFMVCGVVMGALQVFAVGTLTRFMSPIIQIAAGLTLMGVGISALAVTRDFSIMLAWIAVLGIGTAIATPNLAALISDRAEHGTGTALGLKSAAGSLGQFGGPVIGTLLLTWRQSSPFVLGGGVLIAVGVSMAVAPRPRTTYARSGIRTDAESSGS